MTARSRQSPDRDLLNAIGRRCGGLCLPGEVLSVTLDGGDILAEVTVRLRPKVSAADQHAYLRLVVDKLEAHPSILLRSCDSSLARQSRWGGRGHCGKPVTHAAILRSSHDGAMVVEYHCPDHARKAEGRALAVLKIPDDTRRRIRARAQREDAERERLEYQRERIGVALGAFVSGVINASIPRDELAERRARRH